MPRLRNGRIGNSLATVMAFTGLMWTSTSAPKVCLSALLRPGLEACLVKLPRTSRLTRRCSRRAARNARPNRSVSRARLAAERQRWADKGNRKHDDVDDGYSE